MSALSLYLLRWKYPIDAAHFAWCIVVASSEDTARYIHPDGVHVGRDKKPGFIPDEDYRARCSSGEVDLLLDSWVDISDIYEELSIQRLGPAESHHSHGDVLSAEWRSGPIVPERVFEFLGRQIQEAAPYGLERWPRADGTFDIFNPKFEDLWGIYSLEGADMLTDICGEKEVLTYSVSPQPEPDGK